jgi:tRNA G10  N-methylase Trm11
MMTYFFELGREALLSQAEIEAALHLRGIKFTIFGGTQKPYLRIQSEQFSCTGLMEQLGGTVAIGAQLPITEPREEAIIKHLDTYRIGSKIVFSVHGDNHTQLAKKIKLLGKEKGLSIRYIEPNNTATILHNDLLQRQSDIRIIEDQIYITQAIQPIIEFSKRDFGRPERDDFSGMLPPKLSKIMINIASVPKSSTILDPFCGSGTLLAEAALLGYTHLIGSDISERAISDTKKNFLWLQKDYHNISVPELFTSPVETLYTHIPPGSIQAIITEPFLGKPKHGNENEVTLTTEAKKLAELFDVAFGVLHKLLSENGVVVFVVPCFRWHNDWIRIAISPLIAKHGFALLPFKTEEYLLYARPQQHVGREIWRFKKTTV